MKETKMNQNPKNDPVINMGKLRYTDPEFDTFHQDKPINQPQTRLKGKK